LLVSRQAIRRACGRAGRSKEWLGKLTEERILEKVKHRSVTIDKSY
jgi:hypothetical protein